MTSPVPAHLETGSGPAVLFLHGVGGAGDCFAAQLAQFGRSYRAIAWDMPGYGRSQPLPRMTFPALADAAVRLLDALGVERAHLVGHSMGGMVGQEVAVRHADRLATLTLAATSASFGSADGSFQRQFLAERLGPLDAGRGMPDLAPELVAAMVGPDPDPEGVAIAEAAMARVPQAVYRASLECLTSFDRREALGRIPVPTLVIAGAHDKAAPPSGMHRMAAKIPGSAYVLIDEAGHMLPLERPVEFNRAFQAFLDANPGG